MRAAHPVNNRLKADALMLENCKGNIGSTVSLQNCSAPANNFWFPCAPTNGWKGRSIEGDLFDDARS
jgi:hypothetical protein